MNTVPTEATRRGDFSDYRDRNGNLILIYDPLTTRPNPNGAGVVRDPFPGNVIPADRLDQVGLNVASIYPLPNGPGNFDNYTSTVDRTVRDHSLHRPRRPPRGRPRQLLRALRYEKYKLDAPQGQAACCLPTPPDAASRFDLGPFVAGIQNTRLTTHGGGLQLDAPVRADRGQRAARSATRRPTPRPLQSDYGHEAATSLGIQGINVNEFTSGLPNLNIQDVTGISGGPNFLPVNPKQIHYQVEDTRLVGDGAPLAQDRLPLHPAQALAVHEHRTPAAAITINRNLTNNPQTNSQGSGIATLLLGYTTGGTRGFLLDVYDYTNSEHSLFVQDDWKLSDRRHAQPRPALRGLRARHRAGEPPAELRPRRRCGSSTPARTPHGHANKETRWGNLAPRLGIAWDVTGDARNVVRAGYGRSYFPVPLRGREPARAERAELHLAELQRRDEPARLHAGPRAAPVQPVPGHRAGEAAQGTAELNAANPIVFGHAFSNETPHMDTWQLSYERQITNTLMAEVAYAGSKGSNLIWVGNINEVQPGPGTQASRRLIQPLSNVATILVLRPPTNESSYHGLQVKLNKRFSQRPAVPERPTRSASRSTTPARRPRAAARSAARRA